MKKIISLFFYLSICLTFNAQIVDYSLIRNVKYYPDSAYFSDKYVSEKCVLDIYYPKNTAGFATIIWFHGGGLTGGEKEIPEGLKNKGIAIVSVNYRLSPKVTCPKYIEDAATSVAWVFNNIGGYGGNKSLIFVSGHSAGGYLTSMIGLDKKWLAKYNIDANTIAGLLPLSGQAITHFAIRDEKGIPQTQPLIDEYAPLFYVRPDAPPMILITGDRELELLGRYEENAYLMRMMKIVGHKETLLFELQGYDHNMTEPAFPLVLQHIKRITDKITTK